MQALSQAVHEAIVFRYYQEDAIDKTVADALAGFNPVAALPTGSGKSIVLCGIAERLVDNYAHANVLIVSHVKEILEQNHKALSVYFEGIEIGMYSAGLGTKEKRKITVASIQTIINNPELFKDFDYAIIDEAHRVSFEEKTGYRKFIKAIQPITCIGLTATPYRTKGGYIYEGDDALFDKLSVDYTKNEEFLRLIEEGYLSEIYTKKTMLVMDVTGVRVLGGEYNPKDLDEKLNRDNITEAAILESIYFGKKYNHWLVFAINIDHANNIAASLKRNGVSTCVVHSKMEGDDRDKVIADFKAGKYRACVNVEVLTTGFDFPAIDLIIMLRPTKSPIIHVQTAGRGLRPLYAKGYDLLTQQGRLDAIANGGKPHCLVLDYAGNTKRLGPINDPLISKRSDKKGKGQAITKDCPECDIINHGAARFCINCGHEFKFTEKLTLEASRLEMIKRKDKEEKEKVWIAPMWVPVSKVKYSEGSSARAGRFLRVEYISGLSSYQEIVCIESKGFPKHKALNWLRHRWSDPYLEMPKETTKLLRHTDKLLVPKRILVDINGKYPDIKNAEFI